MSVARRISEFRSALVLAALVTLSVVSLVTGARGSFIATGVHRVVGVATYPFLVAMASVEDSAGYLRGLLLDYDGAIGRAGELEVRLAAQLHVNAQRDELAAENRRLRELVGFRTTHPELQLLPARVIQHAQGTLTIDHGSREGVQPSMCVITPDGVVGMVTQAGPFSASVVTLQNPDCRIDVMIERNRVRGRIHGTGNDLSALCRMFYIDINARVREGDRVVTSPDSVFPSGYPVGVVYGTPYQGPLTQSAEVVPTVDPFRLDEVFVVLSAEAPRADLAALNVDKMAGAAPVKLANTETIQERFAP